VTCQEKIFVFGLGWVLGFLIFTTTDMSVTNFDIHKNKRLFFIVVGIAIDNEYGYRDVHYYSNEPQQHG
jgi:hypothetical protein